MADKKVNMIKQQMQNLSDTTRLRFLEFLNKELSLKDFEQWVYKNPDDLEKELNADFYLNLISLNYHQKDSALQLQDMLFSFINKDEFNIWRTKKLLTEIVEEKIDMVLATRKLKAIYTATEDFIPLDLGTGYESELDDVPIPSEYHNWDKWKLYERLRKVDLYKDSFIKDAQEFLDMLNKK
jgi:hypothetical protein